MRTTAGSLPLPHRILGTGVGIPSTVVTNAELVRDLDTTDEWIRSRTGIRERRFLEAQRSTSDLCVEAAWQALAASGVRPADLDAVIVATITPDQPLPSTALIVMEAIGATAAVPFDLNQAACAGGVLGLLLGTHVLQNPHLGHVLVIGADVLSRITDPRDRGTRVFFGDAAGAAVLGRVDEPGFGVLGWDFEAVLSHAVEVPAGGASSPTGPDTVERREHFLRMDGRTVWNEATEHLPKSIEQAVANAGVGLQDVAYFAVHQANRNIVEAVMDRLGVDRARAGLTVDWLGNTGAATVFTVLHEAIAGRRIQRGDIVAIAGIGAGFLWGTLVLRHG